MSRFITWLIIAGIIIWIAHDPAGASSAVREAAGGFTSFVEGL